MAVTKIKPIRGTVNKALAYILDPKKTDDQLYVSSFGCAASDAAAKEFEWTRNLAVQRGMQMPKVIARHLIQSFDVGEVTPEQAHEIGKQFADEWLKGKYEYVIATHIDKGHCHNHIIFNAVNFVDYHAYRSNRRTYREMRQLSDEICKEHGLSVIPPSQSKGMDYKEYTEAKRGTSWKQKLKQTIDRCIITAKDYDEFLKLMQEAGYEIKTGKYISFRAEGQERFTRAKTIARCRPLAVVSPSSAIFRSASSSSAAKVTSIKRSSQFSKKLREHSTISPRTTFSNMPTLKQRLRTFTAPMTASARS
jgi:hypothetical protein